MNTSTIKKSNPSQRSSKPSWIRVRVGGGEKFNATINRIRSHHLNTVCEEASCPNMGHCWSHGRATIMILGEYCTRSCTFCNVKTGRPMPPNPLEPEAVGRSVAESGLKEVVITSVNRDDLRDGGADHWAKVVDAIRAFSPGIFVEVLIPDFRGNRDCLERVLESKPDILGHNCETVPRLYPTVRPQALFQRSLDVLSNAVEAGFVAKSSLMLGLGEEENELLDSIKRIRDTGTDILYMGQYLQPTPQHHPVIKYVMPWDFERYGEKSREMGFGFVASAPLIRSSYHEEGQRLFVEEWRKSQAR